MQRQLRPAVSFLKHRSIVQLTNNSSRQQQTTTRSIYTALPADKKPNPTEPFPWRTFTIPSTYVTSNHNSSTPAADIHVATYNPLGKALKPPQPIIFLPGLTTNHKIFSSLARELNYPYGLVALDFHSRGKSGKVSNVIAQATLKQHVLDLLRVLRSCEQAHAFVVGHGYGGFVGLMAMKLFPHKISGLVLLDSGFPKVMTSTGENSTVDFPAHVLAGLQKELDILSADKVSSTELREALFGKDSSEWANEIDINDFVNYSLENRSDTAALRTAAVTDLHGLVNEMMTSEELFKLRHPLSIVRAEKGFPFGDNKPVMDDKVAKDLQSELNVKDKVVTIKGANHYSMLTGKNVAEVAKAIETLVSRYDFHWRVSTEFEALKEETPQQRKERLEKLRREKGAKEQTTDSATVEE